MGKCAKAKPLFKGHYQPHIPADLGFYDSRVPQVREAQAEMAKEHGISMVFVTGIIGLGMASRLESGKTV